MLYYRDVHYPGTTTPALHERTGKPLHKPTLSSGELAYSLIAKAIVDHGYSLDWAAIEELSRLLRR